MPIPTSSPISFHEVQFPQDISTGAVGGPEFKTTILTLGSGEEKRNVEWSLTRAQYNIGTGLRRRVDFDVFLQFFYARMGRAYGFRFKDWSDYFMANVAWTVGDGSPSDLSLNPGKTQFQLYNPYTSGAWTFYRAILKPVLTSLQGTTALLVNSSTLTLVQGSFSGNTYTGVNPGAGQWTYDPTTGVVKVGTALVAAQTVTIQYIEFDVPVRFDIDKLDMNMAAYEAGEWLNVPIIELKNGQ